MKRTGLTKQTPHPWPFSHGVVVEGQAGVDLRHVVEMTTYATSAELMEPAGRVAQAYFTDPLPAQSFIVVKALARPEQAPRRDPGDRGHPPAARPAPGTRAALGRAPAAPAADLTGLAQNGR